MAPILSYHYVNGDTTVANNPLFLSDQITTLDQASSLIPGGAYTTFRTYPGGKALHLAGHFSRLENSCRLAGYPINLDEEQLRSNLRQLLQQYPGDVARVRVTIPFGRQPAEIYIFIAPLIVPNELQRTQGVKVITTHYQRVNPEAKVTSFIQATWDLRCSLPADIEEVILVDENHSMLEGMTSNFYAVQGSTIQTAGEGVLPGITREIVLTAARKSGLEIDFTPPKLTDVSLFDEAFITSSSRGVLPVTVIDGQPVGSGKPGGITRRLMALYEQQVQAEIEPI